MADKASGTEDTLAAPKLAHGTTRGSDPAVPQPSLRPVGTVTRASSPSLEPATSKQELDYLDLLEVDPAHYTIVSEIARGGMGRILEVRDRRLHRSVAIKEVLHTDDATMVRFEREIRITARLQHPAIVHVHEAGIWPDGKPFYVMKLIRGKPLDARIGSTRTLADRMALLPAVSTVVDALAYAHSERVIHRDLKPANVLVGDFGETIVIDWGIAKELGETAEIVSIPVEKPKSTTDTIAGSVIGTPSYMPPEQAAGDKVDARADVYSLGAMLYQLLAGVPPFVGRTTAEVLSMVIDSSPMSLAAIDPEIPADLIAIVDKAMAKEPRDRFPTANEMAAELKRFQQGKLVASHRYTPWELARRWLRRYRLPVGVAAVMLMLLVVLAIVGVSRIVRERDRADQEARVATRSADEGLIALAHEALGRDPTEAIQRLQQLSPGGAQWDAARTIAADAASRGTSGVLVEEDNASIFLLAYSPDGTKLAAHGAIGTPVVWDVAKRQKQTLYPAKQLFSIAFANNDTLIGVDFENQVWRWTLGDPQGVKLRTLDGHPTRGSLSKDGSQFVAFEHDGCTLHTVATGAKRAIGNYYRGDWATDGKSLLLLDTGKEQIDRVDIATGEITKIAHEDRSPHLIAGDATRVWFAVQDSGRAHGIRALLGDEQGRFAVVAPNEFVREMVPLASGGVVVSTESVGGDADEDLSNDVKGTLFSIDPAKTLIGSHAVRVYESTGADPTVLRGHRARVEAMALSSSGQLATADERGSIRLWRIPRFARIPNPEAAVNRALLSPDGRELVLSRRGPSFEAHDLTTGKIRTLEIDNMPAAEFSEGLRITMSGDNRIRERITNHAEEVVTLVRPMGGGVASVGTRFATLDEKNRAVIWDLATGKGHMLTDKARRIAISPDGRRLATATETSFELWNLDTNTMVTQHKDDIPLASAIALGSNGRIVIAFADGRVFRVEGDQPEVLMTHAPHRMRTIAISPDNTKVIGGGDDAVVWLWDLETKTVRTLAGHTGTIIAVAFSPDGSRVATSSADHDIRVWSIADGTAVVCTGHTALAPTIEFEDADTLISASLDRTARICDLRNGQSRGLVGSTAEVVFAAHVGASVVTVDRFAQIAIHPDNLPRGEPLLRAWLDSASNAIP